jgi:hypothetical protein
MIRILYSETPPPAAAVAVNDGDGQTIFTSLSVDYTLL